MLAAGSNAAEAPVDLTESAARPDRIWGRILDRVGPFLDSVSRQLADQIQTFDPEITPFARYALSNQGKQLRPALVFLSGGATGQVTPAHGMVAVTIEMIHLATLVHDDVMDEAQMRRQRPTAAAHWGNEISVLLGDCLFAHALKLAASFPTPEICRAVSVATKTVCSGEILQTLRRRPVPLPRSDYFKIVEMKTAELFALSCELGACLSGAATAERSALRRYGLGFGTAYQIYDDCVDLFGSEDRAGKSLGTDLATGKITLPILLVLERARPADRTELHELVNEWTPLLLPRLRLLLAKYDALAEARAVIHQFIGASRKALDGVPESEDRASLDILLEFLSQQTGSLGVLS